MLELRSLIHEERVCNGLSGRTREESAAIPDLHGRACRGKLRDMHGAGARDGPIPNGDVLGGVEVFARHQVTADRPNGEAAEPLAWYRDVSMAAIGQKCMDGV